MDRASPRVHPQHVLAVYVEALAVDAHVAVFGDASVGLGARLVELGARAVHVWDPDERRALAQADRTPPGVVVQPYTGDEPVRPVDLAVVADLSLFPDADDLVARLRAMVGDEGVAVVAAANRDYYELFDLMAREFAGVRMVAELPFHGVALVELGGDDELPAVSVDTQLADREREPEAFVVVASQSDVRLDAYTIVELPAPPPAVAPVQAPARPVESPSPDLALVQQVVELSARLDEMRVAAEGGRAVAEAGRAAAARAEESARRADLAERRAGALEHELSRVGEAHASELARFEGTLRERAQAVRALEVEMARRERMVRDLAGALDEAHAAAQAPGAAPRAAAPAAHVSASASEQTLAEENARLCARLDALALDLARREGESHATAWSVAELERRLEQATQATQAKARPGASPEELTTKLRAALDELDALRVAMAREHAARVALEGDQALVTARAEVERQAVLLDQMTRELEARGLAGNSR